MEQGRIGEVGGGFLRKTNQRYVFIFTTVCIFSTSLVSFSYLKVIKCLIVAACLEWSCLCLSEKDVLEVQ